MKLLVLAGDGIGPEITAAALEVLNRADERFALGLALERLEVGLSALAGEGSTCPPAVLEAARAHDGVILGPVDHNAYPPREKGGVNPSGTLRVGLDLFANLRPARARPGLYAQAPTMDLLIVRENTEGFYSDRNMVSGPGEFMPVPGVGLSLRKVTAAGSARIAEVAFARAKRRRGRVTAVHKANVLRLTEGIFLDECRRVAKANPEVEYDEVIVDAAAAWLVRDPARFDVILTTNMFGDILSDEASELAGGLGLAASLNAGDEHAMAQAQHGSAPDIAGQNIANPTSLILSVAMLLDWLGEKHESESAGAAARAIEAAVEAALAQADARTPDLGGSASTEAFAEAVCANLAAD